MNTFGNEYLRIFDYANGLVLAWPSSRAALLETIRSLSSALYSGFLAEHTAILLKTLEDPTLSSVSESYSSWYRIARSDLSVLMREKNVIDRDFQHLMIIANRCSCDHLLSHIKDKLYEIRKTDAESFQQLAAFYQRYKHFWGDFEPEADVYEHFILAINEVKEQLEDFQWLYKRLADYRSKKTLLGILHFWITLDFAYLDTIKDNMYDDYFDLDLLSDHITPSMEVFVDCGAYNGDTIESYLRNYSEYHHLYLYDMVPANLDVAREKFKKLDNIEYRNVGVGDFSQKGQFIKVSNYASSEVSVKNDRTTIVPGIEDAPDLVDIPIVTLDEDISEPITFLKMDIEGSEISAINGARAHIMKDRPKLAICTYHSYPHLWQIPRLIDEIRSDYTFYLRYQGLNIMTMEHYLLAL
jgi:FkbM family methyltransferase